MHSPSWRHHMRRVVLLHWPSSSPRSNRTWQYQSDGTIDAEYYRQTVDLILKACLPPEDYEPEVERVIIREVLKTILDLIGPIDDDPYPLSQSSPSTSSDTSFFQSIIILILSALQSFSGACLALIHSYKQAINTIKLVNQSPTQPAPDPSMPPKSPVAITPPQPCRTDSTLINTVSSANSQSISDRSSVNSNHLRPPDDSPGSIPVSSPSVPQEYSAAPLAMLSEIINAKDRFATTLLLSTLSMTSTYMTPFLDKLLPYLLRNFLSPAFILNVTRTSKRTMFPNGYPGPPPIEPTSEEQAHLRAKLLAWRGKGATPHILPFILGPDASATLSTALDPLTDAQCNVRLLVFIFDRILISLFPELVN
ncbi:hypothetical protein NMY22_g19009 [Coprinellus aureogranulatus]|nr:hypothetical protein NMY22_g19009 [Coprinellus aureogranulatus]